MRAIEFINEESELEEGPRPLTTRDAQKLLKMLGYYPDRVNGSHHIWKGLAGEVFSLPVHGKEIGNAISKNLLKLVREKGININEALK